MINTLSKTLVIAGMSVALLGGVAEAKNNKNNRFNEKIQKTEVSQKKSKRAQQNRASKRQLKRSAFNQRASLTEKRTKRAQKQNKLIKRVNIKRSLKTTQRPMARPLKKVTPLPDKRVTTPKIILGTDKRVTTPKTVVTEKNQDPTSGRLNARKNKDEYFKCAKFSTSVLNSCMADANRKGQTTKPCLTHYQGNIGRCQAKFL